MKKTIREMEGINEALRNSTDIAFPCSCGSREHHIWFSALGGEWDYEVSVHVGVTEFSFFHRLKKCLSHLFGKDKKLGYSETILEIADIKNLVAFLNEQLENNLTQKGEE